MQYGDGDLGQQWCRYWLVAWRPQVISWTIVDLPSKSSPRSHSTVMFICIHRISIPKLCLKFAYFKSQTRLKGSVLSMFYTHVIFECVCGFDAGVCQTHLQGRYITVGDCHAGVWSCCVVWRGRPLVCTGNWVTGDCWQCRKHSWL